jgi:polyisoprenoid-binding protein YceI
MLTHATTSTRSRTFALVVFLLLAIAPVLGAQETVVTLDSASAQVSFTLGATMHTVHGSFHLKSGEIRFDPATGKAAGSVVVDAASGNTDNSSRDKKMHAEVLESSKFSEISFTPSEVKGSLKDIADGARANGDVAGIFHLHGQDHDGSANVTVEHSPDGVLHITAKFAVPYVSWGLKDESSTFLHVKNTVDVEVRATGRVASAH